jgi:hypothetical protein
MSRLLPDGAGRDATASTTAKRLLDDRPSPCGGAVRVTPGGRSVACSRLWRRAVADGTVGGVGVIDPGTAVTGRSGREWRIGAELGRGGTAIVYEALSDDLVDAAAKVLSAHRFPVDAGMRRRFQREGALLSCIDSHHVVRVLDEAVFHGEPILFLERLDTSLYAALSEASPGPPSLSSAVTWLWQALLGVAAMHLADMVHRDLSPKNLLLRADGALVVGDFGTVRHLDDEAISDTGAALGSLIYISRQQFGNSHTATARDDVYSLGQIAYELLSGWRPSYALTLPRNSVGSAQIRTGAVRSAELRNRTVRLSDVSLSARRALRGSQGPTGPAGPPAVSYRAAVSTGGVDAKGNSRAVDHRSGTNEYRVEFERDVSACVYTATLAAVQAGPTLEQPQPGRITVGNDGARVLVRTFAADAMPAEQPFHLTVAC